MPIQDRLAQAQGGQALANLARAFHLPPAKVQPAVDSMVTALIPLIEAKLPSRRFLAKLLELFGKGAHRQVLENPAMLGATSTQVLGSDTLNVIAGREAAKKAVREAAAKSEASEMVAEYLLPVVAAMLLGALADVSRQRLEQLVESKEDGFDARGPQADAIMAPLPQVAASGLGFSGSSGGGVALATPAVSDRLLRLSHCIRDGVALPDGREAAEAARRVLRPYLGLPKGPLDWIARLRGFGSAAFKTAGARKRT